MVSCPFKWWQCTRWASVRLPKFRTWYHHSSCSALDTSFCSVSLSSSVKCYLSHRVDLKTESVHTCEGLIIIHGIGTHQTFATAFIVFPLLSVLIWNCVHTHTHTHTRSLAPTTVPAIHYLWWSVHILELSGDSFHGPCIGCFEERLRQLLLSRSLQSSKGMMTVHE